MSSVVKAAPASSTADDTAMRPLSLPSETPAPALTDALPTFDGLGIQAGVDLDDSAALLDLMERSRGPS